MAAGLAIMLSGVLVARLAEGAPHALAIVADVTGYGIHAVGAAPFVEWLLAET